MIGAAPSGADAARLRVLAFSASFGEARRSGFGAEAVADVQLRVEAGLGGFARPGRWTPVRVAIENGRDDFAGDLVVEWGDVRVRRAVTLPSSARRQLEMYVRSANVRDVIVVRLQAGERASQSVETPIRIVRVDEPLIACVGRLESPSRDPRSCTVALAAESLPSSWRGYDAADDVIAGGQTIAADKQRAIDFWRAMRTLEDSGQLSAPRELDPIVGVQPRLRAAFLAYVIAIPASLFIVRRRARGAGAVYVTVAVLIVSATTAAIAMGRAGPGSAIAVRYSGMVHQFPDATASFVSMRGTAEYPTAGRFDLRAPLTDSAFDSAGAREDQRLDDGGAPILSGRFALGARKAFSLEGVAELAIVTATPRSSSMHVSNVSPFVLDDCSVRTGFQDRPLGALASGSSLDIAGADDQSLSLACLVPASVLPFAEAQRRVMTEGQLRLVFHLQAEPRQP
jgi:hypothetical protein